MRLLVLDVDGVLTDGRLYFSARGEELKVFTCATAPGSSPLLRAGIAVAIISGRNSAAVDARAASSASPRVQGVQTSGAALDALAATNWARHRDALACVGDDTADLPMFERAGLAIAVADAHASASRRATG